MDNSNNKHKSRPSFSETSSGKEGPFRSNQWQENNRDRRDPTKNRSQDSEWNREKSFHGKNKENPRDEEAKTFRDEQSALHVQQASFPPAYNYNAADHSYVDSNRRASIMMPYNMMAPPWNVNPVDAMAMTQNNMTMNQTASAVPIPTGMEIVPASSTNVNPYAFMAMPGDNMYGMVGMGNYCQYGMMPAQENMYFPPIKEVIHLTNSVLYPPNPNAPRPTTRGKPLGCKTVFVGGMPEKATEEIMREIFSRCGTVETIRLSKKNFCHIRFNDEMFVENAIYFSGYRLKIENKDEAPFTGRLHVDYAQARHDQYDYECRQRSLQRQARHQQEEDYRPATPPYTNHEASLICEKLKNEETFSQTASILIAWLERGECTKKNSGSFYSMIQSTHNHVIKLQADKVKYEDQLSEAKKMLKKQLEKIMRQFTEIGKIYKAASLQKCWDHFTKAQRTNIKVWKKQTEELKNAHVEEVINEREDEEMELTDDENEEKNNCDGEQEESDSLRCQLEAAQNEIIVMQSDHEEELKRKDCQISALRQALQSSNKEVENMNQRCVKEEAELKELRLYKCRSDDGKDEINSIHSEINLGSWSTSCYINNEKEARLIGLISTFLNAHPFGANIDYICSYLHQIDSTIKTRDVENLMKRFPTIFREESTGIGASLGKKWRFTGFEI